MPELIKVAEATAGRKSRQIVMLDSSRNPITGLVDADFTGWLFKDGAGAARAGVFTEKDATNAPGFYDYTPSTGEKATAGACLLIVSAAGAIGPVGWPFDIIGNDVYAASAVAPANFALLLIDAAGKVTLAPAQTHSTTGSVGSVTGSVGSVSGAVATVTALGTQAKADVTAAVPAATAIATAVWANATRTLSSFGTLVADVATAVWAAVTRTLTANSDSAGVTSLLTSVAAVKVKTDNLPADTGAAIDGIPAAILDLASAIDGYTPRQVLGIMLAILRGKLSGMENNSPKFRDAQDTLDRVIAVTDDNDNRITVVVDLTGL